MDFDEAGSSSLVSFLNQPLESVVSLWKEQVKKISESIGNRVFDLIVMNIPEKYQKRTLALSVRDLVPGKMVTLKGRIKTWTKSFGKSPSVLLLEFEQGDIKVTFFGRIGRIYAKSFPPDQDVLVSGEVQQTGRILTMTHPDILKYDETSKELISGYVPLYKKIKGVSHFFMLRVVSDVLKQLRSYKSDWIPKEIYGKYGFPGFLESVSNIHFPMIEADLEVLNDIKSLWHQRLAFDKLFFFKYGAMKSRAKGDVDKKRKVEVCAMLSRNCERAMDFELTAAQKRVLQEIRQDLKKSSPMNRLLQGDVGSGKTAVMVLAGLDVVASGYKVVIMAPTEILARQHEETIKNNTPESVKTELFVGGVSGKKKKEKRLENAAKANFIVGTHAVFENLEVMEDIGLVIVDEQHRFGVSQRMKLAEKAKHPDVLVVSATPIPRSLAHTVYGATDISLIDEMPPGRISVKTRYVPFTNRSTVFNHVVDIIQNKGRGGYWICPLVEESEKIDLQHVSGVFEQFNKVLDGKVLLLHGKMKGEEKNRVINSLKNGLVNLLVSTVVVEVGVDVTNATFMVIENAERFGLAQLHQLRGRVGRGKEKSFCALISGENVNTKAIDRLDYIALNNNGFKVAEYDLKARGPGALTGLEQSGFRNDPYFMLAARYGGLVEKALQNVVNILNNHKKSSLLKLIDEIFEQFFLKSYNCYRTG